MNYTILCDYVTEHSTPPPPYLDIIYRAAQDEMFDPHLMCTPSQGRLLAMLSKIVRPARILELGTFVGYSALCLAEGLLPDGELITVEKDDELEGRIVHNMNLSPYRAQIRLYIDEAIHFLTTQAMCPNSFDLIYIDADKRQYVEYLTLCLPLLRFGGLMIADNTLWDGHVIDTRYQSDKKTASLKRFNEQVCATSQLETIIIPAYDGITVSMKRG